MRDRMGFSYDLSRTPNAATSAATLEFLSHARRVERRRALRSPESIRAMAGLARMIGRPVLLGCLQAFAVWYMLR